jgi:type IV pilus assembly protein PilY1
LRGGQVRTTREPTGRLTVRRATALVQIGAVPGAAATTVASSTASWPVGRLSWREVANWRRLHGSATGQGQ